MDRNLRDQLQELKDGRIEPGSELGRKIVREALIDDVVQTARSLVGFLPLSMIVGSMRDAGFNPVEIGHILYPDPKERSAFLKQERVVQAQGARPDLPDTSEPDPMNPFDPNRIMRGPRSGFA